MFSAEDDVFSPEQAAAWQRERHAELCGGHRDGDGDGDHGHGHGHGGRGRQPGVLEGPGFLYRPRQILVGTADPAALAYVTAELSRRGGVIDEQTDSGFDRAGLPVRAFLMPAEVDLPGLVSELRQGGDGAAAPDVAVNHVLSGEPDYHGGPAGEPLSAKPFPEPGFDGGDSPPVVAVLDTGFDPEVQQLHPNLFARLDFDPADIENPVLPSGFLAGEGGHGSFIDGIVMQMAPRVRVRQVKVLNPAGVGDDAAVALALTAAARAGIKVINLSLGGYAQDDVPPAATSAAIAQLKDTVVVAAAGNNRQARKFFPAALDGVIAVGALDTRDPDEAPVLARFSNFGPWVDIYVPGVRILSTYLRDTWKLPDDPHPRPMDGYAYWSGTSFAAPQVAAMIADAIPGAGTARHAAAQVLALARHKPGIGPVLIPDSGVVGLSAVAEADKASGRSRG